MAALDFPTSPTDGDTYAGYTYNGTKGVWEWDAVIPSGIPDNGYTYVDTVYFTSNGTFTKATYPWLRAIRVKCVGGGGGSGGAAATSSNQNAIGGGGGGGGYSESFITDIAGLDASVTVTRGAGGAGGAAGANVGSAGGASSFGSAVVANGGAGGSAGLALTAAAGNYRPGSAGATLSGAAGDLTIRGGSSSVTFYLQAGFAPNFPSGGSFLGLGGTLLEAAAGSGLNGAAGSVFGGGATGAINAQNDATTRSGGAGGNGIVIVELYA